MTIEEYRGISFIAHQSFANEKPYEVVVVLTPSLTRLIYGRNKSKGTSSVRKPSANSNNASMFLRLCSFHDGFEFGGNETCGTSSPIGKFAIIKSNPPNLQMLNETQVLRVWPICKKRQTKSNILKKSNTYMKQKGILNKLKTTWAKNLQA